MCVSVCVRHTMLLGPGPVGSRPPCAHAGLRVGRKRGSESDGGGWLTEDVSHGSSGLVRTRGLQASDGFITSRKLEGKVRGRGMTEGVSHG